MPKAEAALRELLRGKPTCETDSAPRDIHYQPGKVSHPERARSCRFLEDIASPECRSYLEEEHRRKRLGPETVDLDSMARWRMMDAALRRNPKAHRTLVLCWARTDGGDGQAR
eukprot:7630708-Pyramimonas_sp.AAC.1